MVPVGSTTCVVCEAPIDPPPRLPIINAQLNNLNDIKVLHITKIPCITLMLTQQGKPVCLACGTINGAEMKICVTCEKPLESHFKQEREEQNENTKSMTGNTVSMLDMSVSF